MSQYSSMPPSPDSEDTHKIEQFPNPPTRALENPPLTFRHILRSLSWTDRLLPLFILLAIVGGALIGNYVPKANQHLNRVQVSDVSLPLFIGLLVMMYPVLCKVEYERIGKILRQRDFWYHSMVSFGFNCIIGPLAMTGLAWATLPDLPDYRTGVILIGIARCIAMVLIWNELAGGEKEYCALLVAFNSILQIALYAPLALLYVKVMAPASEGDRFHIDYWIVARSVLIFLGIPLGAAILTRFFFWFVIRRRTWYTKRFLPIIGPWALVGLLFTIVVMFISQGEAFIHRIGSVARVSVPLLLYFPIMFFSTFYVCYRLRYSYAHCVTQSFTSASNNFELAIAVTVAVFGLDSPQALASVVGPLIEVPVLLALVYLCLWIQARYFQPSTKLYDA
ncbi:arsenicals resistance [Dispira simplex]|nr:arsenicals resistance [Dispira simplex]